MNAGCGRRKNFVAKSKTEEYPIQFLALYFPSKLDYFDSNKSFCFSIQVDQFVQFIYFWLVGTDPKGTAGLNKMGSSKFCNNSSVSRVKSTWEGRLNDYLHTNVNGHNG